MKGEFTMSEDYLILLENIRDKMEEIEALEESLHTILNAPEECLAHLEHIRNTLAEIRELSDNA